MIKKLVQHGNTSALISDKPIMELLKINNNTHLELSTDGSNIIISPVKSKDRVKKLNKSLDLINKKHQFPCYKSLPASRHLIKR